jgi:hypothetical protein
MFGTSRRLKTYTPSRAANFAIRPADYGKLALHAGIRSRSLATSFKPEQDGAILLSFVGGNKMG